MDVTNSVKLNSDEASEFIGGGDSGEGSIMKSFRRGEND